MIRRSSLMSQTRLPLLFLTSLIILISDLSKCCLVRILLAALAIITPIIFSIKLCCLFFGGIINKKSQSHCNVYLLVV